MGVLVLFSALFAFAFPDFVGHVKPYTINYMLGLVMFGMGLTLDYNDFRNVFAHPKYVALGCLSQFTVMPLLALVISCLFDFDEGLTIGMVLVGCCPGGTASNVITYLAKGDVALSVGMTAVSTLLALFLTPVLVWACVGTTVDVDIVSMFMSIVWVVILPIVIGGLIKRTWTDLTHRIVEYLPAFSSIVIALIVAIVIAFNADKLREGGLLVLAAVMLHNVIGLGLGYSIGSLLGLDLTKRKTISIEVGMQNSGLASSLAVIHFASFPIATVPGAFFSVWHNISGAIVAKLYSKSESEH